jgi:Ca2+/Na+ antiporter
MNPLLKEIRHDPLLWLLVFVPVVFAAANLKPAAHTLLFILSVLAIVPLAALLSHATESVAAKTGDAVGGLLNATLGNLTELVIALTALRAGEYMLVKASIAGTIVTNVPFVLGASFFLGGLKHHVQEFNRVGARMQAGLLFLATVALLIPSAVSRTDFTAGAAFNQKLSVGLAVLLILTYGLGMLFSLKTHRELFVSAESVEVGESPWPIGLGLATLAAVTVVVAAGKRDFCRVSAEGSGGIWDDSRLRGFHRRGAGRRRGGNGLGVFRSAQEPTRPECGHRLGQRVPNRALCRSDARPVQLHHRPEADGPAILAWRSSDDFHRHPYRIPRHEWRSVDVVRGCISADGLSCLRHDTLPLAAPSPMREPSTDTSLRCKMRSVVHSRRSRLVSGFLQFSSFLFVAALAAPGAAEGRITEHEIETGTWFQEGYHPVFYCARHGG